MSDREEFEKWYTHNFGRRATEFGYETDICWQAWQAARAQSGQGAEVVGYLHNRPERIPCFFETLEHARLSDCEVVPVYTHPQPAQQGVPESIATDDDVERVAKMVGWDNRRYMTPPDYAEWCRRMREFVRLSATPQPEGDVLLVPVDAVEYLRDQWPGAYAKFYARAYGVVRPQPPQEGEGDE